MAIKTYKLRAGAESEVAGYMIPLSNGKKIGLWGSRKYSTDNIDIQNEIEKDPLFRKGTVVLAETTEEVKQSKPATMNVKKIFIVHGRDRSMRETVSEYIKSLDLEPVILFKQTNKGKTIIEKIEECASGCSYAIVLLSPDDHGGLIGEKTTQKPRARQNVILELGYMWGKLGRDKVAMLYRDNVEKPSDADGIVHIPYHQRSGWREQLRKELEDTGLWEKKVIVNSTPTLRIENTPSLLDKAQVSITKRDGFLTPTISATFPIPGGKIQAIHMSADQIKGTRSEFISAQHEFHYRALPYLYAHGLNHGDIILGMIWDYWHKIQNEQTQ